MKDQLPIVEDEERTDIENEYGLINDEQPSERRLETEPDVHDLDQVAYDS